MWVGVQISPTTLFMVQGLAQQGLGVCWGDGFSVNQDQISQFTGAQSAQSFLDEIVGRPYVGNVIISPHYYGPSISKNTARWAAGCPVAAAALHRVNSRIQEPGHAVVYAIRPPAVEHHKDYC